MTPDKKEAVGRRLDILFLILFAVLAAAAAVLIAMSSLLTGEIASIAAEIVLPILLWGVPAVSLAWFVTSLVLFCRAPKQAELRSARLHSLIRSAVVLGVIASVYAGIFFMLMMAVRNM